MSDFEEFMRDQPAYRRRVYAHLLAIATLTGIMFTVLLTIDEAFVFGWWLAVACSVVDLMLISRAQMMIAERRAILRKLMKEYGWNEPD